MKGIWSICFFLPWCAVAGAEIPEPVFPAGVGVNIHFVTGHEADLDLLAAGGFKFVRMDFGWEATEKQKGQFDWNGYDELTANLEKRGLRAVYILDYSNPLYEEAVESKDPTSGRTRRTTASPQHPESVAAFASWAAAAARHFHGRHILWEIWNEPNIQFWSPKPDVEQYGRLALATCKAIRAAEPAATIIGPASSGFPWKFLENFLESGVLEYLDAVSVHPYRDYRRGPETAAADYSRLCELINRFAPIAKRDRVPILSGEWGYATHTRGVSLETQAAFAVRQQIANVLNGVPLSIWYDWKNDGPDAAEREHNFGTVTAELKPKPAYLTLQRLARELSGYRPVRRIPLESENDYVVLCTDNAGEQKLVAWTASEPRTVRFKISLEEGHNLVCMSGDGQPSTLVVKSGELQLPLSPLPCYVTLGAAALK
jgi:hypothetical protein